MTREEAKQLMYTKIKNKNLRKHSLAVEAVMRRLADHFKEDVELWGLAGILHDLDYEETKNEASKHSLVAAKMLEELGLPPEVVQSVKVHNDIHGLPRKTLLDKALFCTDPLTGLIVAAALITPEKKIDALDANFLLNRYREKSFARGANRRTIASCEELGLSLEEFFTLGLEGMREIAGELGL